MGFVHLHNHTEFSFLDGLPTLPDLVKHVSELGQTAVAMTDHAEVSGHYKFQQACKAGDILPVFGLEGYFVDDVTERTKSYDYNHITLLAVSQVGLANLWKLSSRAFIEGFYYKPRLDWNILKDHAEGIVATGGCMNGVVAKYLREGQETYSPQKADERIGRFYDILGDRFYLELHTFPNDEQRLLNKALAEKGTTYGVPLIAVSDSHYLRSEDWEEHEILIAAGMRKTWDDPKRYTYGPGALAVLSEDEVYERLTSHLPADLVRKAMDNTVDIAESSRGTELQVQRTYPVFLSKPEEDEEKLQRDAWTTFDIRLKPFNLDEMQLEEYRQRLTRELRLVVDKGYAGYFLIVAEAIQWAKERGILIGPGRGSAGGSLLSYVLGIIELDPIKANLLFERFLDPSLTQLPDIDVDVPQKERDQVIAHLREKYETATIGTLQTLKPRMLLKDLCRVLKIPNEVERPIGELIENTPDLTVLDLKWPQVCDRNGNFKKWRTKEPKLFQLMDHFASHHRHSGAHASALVVNREPLLGLLPLRRKDEDIRTQMSMDDVEALGYMKMDFLGVRNLSTLMRARDLALKGWEPDSGKPEPKPFYDWQYEWDKYYGDQDAYQSLWDGRNVGVFQLETEGFSEVTRRYKPTSMEDMCAIVSLFRPGITRAIDPDTNLNLMEVMLQKREGRLPVTYRHELLEPILSNTFGAFLYQEQVMQTVRDIGDFSPEEQSKIRKIIGKTKPEVMKKFKDTFIERATAKGIEIHTAEAIWSDMESFGVYGFNRSHGYAYGMISYWTAWMKHHYPAEFMTACFQTNEKEIKLYNRECRRMDIPLLGPDINDSEADFSVSNGAIRYGFHGVKYVANASEVIQNHRPFASAAEAAQKLHSVNRRVLESLIVVGALDSVVTPEDRTYLPEDWSAMKVAMWHLYWDKKKKGKRETKALTEQELIAKYIPEFEAEEYLAKVDDLIHTEPEYLGENVTTLPFGEYLDAIIEHYSYPGARNMVVEEMAKLGGTISEVKKTRVKKEGKNKGREMAQIWVEYPVMEDGKVVDIENQKMVMFPDVYVALNDKVKAKAPVIIKAKKLQDRDGFEGGLMVEWIYRMDRGEFPHSNGDHVVEAATVPDITQEAGYWD